MQSRVWISFLTFFTLLVLFLSSTIAADTSTASSEIKLFPLTQRGLLRSRADIIQRVKQETSEEVVADMGNLNMSEPGPGGGATFAGSIEFYGDSLPLNVHVARLIAEGRVNPDRIASLVEHQLQNNLSMYAQKEQKFLKALQSDGTNAWLSSEDIQYRATREYGDPRPEFDHVNYMINASFYILVNIGRLPNLSTAAQWLTTNISIRGYYVDPSLRAWIIYQYAISPKYRDQPAWQKLRTELEATELKSTLVAAPRWDMNHPIDAAMFKAHPDSPDVAIVIDIPRYYKIDPQQYQTIKNQFLALAH